MSVAERFWAKVKKGRGCWTWTAGCHSFGYGQLRVAGRNVLAHRLSWELAHGLIPIEKWVLHRCDNPPCVRPSHLFLGTPAANYADCRAKRRHYHGQDHPDAKLTEQLVRELHAAATAGVSRARLAFRFGLSHTSVDKICGGLRWRHLGLTPLPKPGYWRGPRK